MSAAIKMMETDLAGPLNIGSDVEINITDIAKKIITAVGSSSKIGYAEEHFFMTQLCLPDISRVREELGWMPVVMLERGLEKTIDDLRAGKGLKGVREAVGG
jgi:nucleoside-diphosphate-sugar epimerase